MPYGRMTLLDLTQSILDKMDSDEVNSISDTPESLQVAGEVRDSYRAMISGIEDYHRKGFIGLHALADGDFPNQLEIPDRVVQIETLWYDVYEDGLPQRRELIWEDPEVFIERSNRLNGIDDGTVRRVQPYGVNVPGLFIRCDENPEYYTSFDNRHIFTDAVNLSVEDTLQASNTAAWGTLSPEFRMEDTFVPDLRVDEFTQLLNEAIDACFIHFKGVSNSKAQKRARDQMVRGQNNRRRISSDPKFRERPPFERRARGGSLRNRTGRRATNPSSF